MLIEDIVPTEMHDGSKKYKENELIKKQCINNKCSKTFTIIRSNYKEQCEIYFRSMFYFLIASKFANWQFMGLKI